MIFHPPTKVMVVDDSAVIRGLLSRIIDGQPDMRVVATAMNGQAALDVLSRKEVDVVLLDIEMPVMDGLEALPLILKEHPAVRVVMASSLTKRGAHVTIKALSLGAADYVAKPTAGSEGGIDAIAAELVEKVRALGPARMRPSSSPASSRTEESVRTPVRAPTRRSSGHAPAPEVLAVTSSTGGPNALREVLSGLPADFPLPILIVQHMPPLFTGMLAERLHSVTGRPSGEAVDGGTVEGGHIYVAPGDRHMVVERRGGGLVTVLDDGPPENFCRPSADPLFRSLARAVGSAVLGLVLTGMGHDGLEGCRALVAAGGRVLAQDQESSVVWGMPGAVVSEDLAEMVLPLQQIAGQIAARTRARVT